MTAHIRSATWCRKYATLHRAMLNHGASLSNCGRLKRSWPTRECNAGAGSTTCRLSIAEEMDSIFLDCTVFWYMAGGLGHSGATFGALVLNVFASLSVSLNRSSKLGKIMAKTSPPILKFASSAHPKLKTRISEHAKKTEISKKILCVKLLNT